MMGAESWRRLEGVHIFSHFTPHRKEEVTSYLVLFAASAFEKVCFESVAGGGVEWRGKVNAHRRSHSWFPHLVFLTFPMISLGFHHAKCYRASIHHSVDDEKEEESEQLTFW